MIEKNEIMILCSICTLIFVSGGKGGMPGLSHALVPAQESKRWSFGQLLLLPVIQKGLFLGPKKARKKLETQIRASPVQDSCHGCCLC